MPRNKKQQQAKQQAKQQAQQQAKQQAKQQAQQQAKQQQPKPREVQDAALRISIAELRLKRLEAKPTSLHEKYSLLTPFDDTHYQEFQMIEHDRAGKRGMSIEEWIVDPLENEKLKVAISLKITAEQWNILSPYTYVFL